MGSCTWQRIVYRSSSWFDGKLFEFTSVSMLVSVPLIYQRMFQLPFGYLCAVLRVCVRNLKIVSAHCKTPMTADMRIAVKPFELWRALDAREWSCLVLGILLVPASLQQVLPSRRVSTLFTIFFFLFFNQQCDIQKPWLHLLISCELAQDLRCLLCRHVNVCWNLHFFQLKHLWCEMNRSCVIFHCSDILPLYSAYVPGSSHATKFRML